jgi:hypothetical protein
LRQAIDGATSLENRRTARLVRSRAVSNWSCQRRPDDGSRRLEQRSLDVVEAVGGGRTVQEHDDAVERAGVAQAAADLAIEEGERLAGQATARLRGAAHDRHRLHGGARPDDALEISADRADGVGVGEHVETFEDSKAGEVGERGRCRVEAAGLLHDLDEGDAHRADQLDQRDT